MTVSAGFNLSSFRVSEFRVNLNLQQFHLLILSVLVVVNHAYQCFFNVVNKELWSWVMLEPALRLTGYCKLLDLFDIEV